MSLPIGPTEAQQTERHDGYRKMLHDKGWDAPIMHTIGTPEEHHKARLELLKLEKELMKKKDEMLRLRQKLPMVPINKQYQFQQTDGSTIKLDDLFTNDRSDLVVYHLMFDPSWSRPCSSCSAWVDSLNGVSPHVQAKANIAVIGKASPEKLKSWSEQNGWNVRVLSSQNTDFNVDFGVEFTAQQIASGEKIYNHGTIKPSAGQWPGVSVFHRDEKGVIYHTYSTYARGLEPLNVLWSWLDILPEGRGTFLCDYKSEYSKVPQAQPQSCTACNCKN